VLIYWHNLMFFWPCIIVETCFNYQLNAQFLYSIKICILHYNPRHVSSNIMLILRRSNCIVTIWPPEDEHSIARNMSRIIMQYTYYYRIEELFIKFVIETSLTEIVSYTLSLPLRLYRSGIYILVLVTSYYVLNVILGLSMSDLWLTK
jgi:hypothetical protein